MKSIFRRCVAVGIAIAGFVVAGAPVRAQNEPMTEENVIEGTMTIDFNTRTSRDTTGDLKDGSAALGAKDRYAFNLTVAKTTQFSGEITRQPNLYTRTLHRLKQPAQIMFKSDLFVLNPKDL